MVSVLLIKYSSYYKRKKFKATFSKELNNDPSSNNDQLFEILQHCEKKKDQTEIQKCSCQGSNLGPSACEADVITTTLQEPKC